MKVIKFFTIFLCFCIAFTACKKEDKSPEISKSVIENVEIGTGNNKRALRGRDFHFNADVIAGSKIKEVKLSILQRSTETYTAPWQLEFIWPEYSGTKNTNVHKHFTLPATAPEGKYDFIFSVTDENGTVVEIKEDLVILDPANLPVDPKIGRDFVSRNGTLIYYTDIFEEKELILKKGDELSLHAQISEIKGDGILYSILVKKKSNYHPESIDNLDFSKAIVVTKVTHQNLGDASKISTLKLTNGVYGGETIVIGATHDGYDPIPAAISAEKSWESGQYNWIILYKNTTFNSSVFKSIPITIDYSN